MKNLKQKFMQWLLPISFKELTKQTDELTAQVESQERRIYLLSHLAICEQKTCGIRSAALASGEEYILERSERELA